MIIDPAIVGVGVEVAIISEGFPLKHIVWDDVIEWFPFNDKILISPPVPMVAVVVLEVPVPFAFYRYIFRWKCERGAEGLIAS